MPLVAIIMGSKSDYEHMKGAEEVLREFGVEYETRVVSAHRTPEFMIKFGIEAEKAGLKAIIAGAGGAAHLPGMVASVTNVPVIGVPVPSKHLNGLDSLLSIVQMPYGVPVATVAIGNSKNAALLALRIIGNHDEKVREKLTKFRKEMEEKVLGEKI
ncbi:MAG: 5-(carboxyamino)imidazole ribonucleotide mutase [Candidatus Thermoplasmatota archaeon]|nr:5-(carboxyamino)imidazole ribonucleotide mutase [Candidatus Thermoplasmatota archaeon]MCL5786006.1 5-(carboxyamino)imidazole ribonucleotide mutase [Candidatus Thermoplasmatota archaeon]